jgi:hypothetical protein
MRRESMHRFLAGAVLSCPLFAGAAGAQGLETLPKQTVIESRFIELNADFRKFLNWEDVSGNDAAVVQHETKSVLYGGGITLGQRLGDRPIWATVGGYYGTGLETHTSLANGNEVNGDVDNIGVGGGLRILPYNAVRFGLFLWAMGFYEWNNGDFETIDGETRTENRIHKTWTGDYGLGALYLLSRAIGIDFGLGYNGQFNKKNADEAFRVFLGLYINGPG